MRPDFLRAEQIEGELRAAGVSLSPESGMLIALSGGADSVYLLRLMQSLAQKRGFRLAAMHVEHGIRGKESLADAAFCRSLCAELSIEFHLASVDVMGEAAKSGEGIEAAARRLRYAELESKRGELGLTYIVTAHNESDQAETVLFHLLRGSGAAGLSGMPILRGRLLRPLLSLSGNEIRRELDAAGIAYVTDSTNADLRYTRNYLRNSVMPMLAQIVPAPSHSIARAAKNIAADLSALDDWAEAVLASPEQMRRSSLSALPDAVLARVISSLYRKAGGEMAESVHIEAALAQIRKSGVGEVVFPGQHRLIIGRDSVCFDPEKPDFPETELQDGMTEISGIGRFFLEIGAKDALDSRIVYKKSKKVYLSSAKIEGKLFVRRPLPGDSYRYGGMTHSVKKLFASRHLSDAERARMPILLDARGILWVPGFGAREGADGRGLPPCEQTVVSFHPCLTD